VYFPTFRARYSEILKVFNKQRSWFSICTSMLESHNATGDEASALSIESRRREFDPRPGIHFYRSVFSFVLEVHPKNILLWKVLWCVARNICLENMLMTIFQGNQSHTKSFIWYFLSVTLETGITDQSTSLREGGIFVMDIHLDAWQCSEVNKAMLRLYLIFPLCYNRDRWYRVRLPMTKTLLTGKMSPLREFSLVRRKIFL
jgi:hypothetical protein